MILFGHAKQKAQQKKIFCLLGYLEKIWALEMLLILFGCLPFYFGNYNAGKAGRGGQPEICPRIKVQRLSLGLFIPSCAFFPGKYWNTARSFCCLKVFNKWQWSMIFVWSDFGKLNFYLYQFCLVSFFFFFCPFPCSVPKLFWIIWPLNSCSAILGSPDLL